MQPLSAYLLVFHGSSSPCPQAGADLLAQFFSQRIHHSLSEVALGSDYLKYPAQDIPARDRVSDGTLFVKQSPMLTSSQAPVGVASLEGGSAPLHQQIGQFAETLLKWAADSGRTEAARIVILPLFLLRGVHVMEDIPTEVALAQQALGTDISLEIAPHLGSHPGLYRLLTERMSPLPAEAWILLAHGSRHPDANQPIEALAERLGAVSAYWSVSPELEIRLQELVNLGLRKIAILPYFLFSGSITEAIAQRILSFSQQDSSLDLHLSTPLQASPELADLLVDLAREPERRESGAMNGKKHEVC